MGSEPLTIDLTGEFTADIADLIERNIDLPGELELALGRGLNAERTLKIVADTSDKAISLVKKILDYVYQADRVTGVKITRNSVEIGSMRAQDGTKVRKFIDDVLNKID